MMLTRGGDADRGWGALRGVGMLTGERDMG